MKKFFFALMCIAAVTLVGCKTNDPNKSGTNAENVDPTKVDDKTDKCWAVGITETLNGAKRSYSMAVWGTEKEVVEQCQEWLKTEEEGKKAFGESYTISVKYLEFSDAKDEAACEKQEKVYEEEYEAGSECFEYTLNYTYSGQAMKEVGYVWCTEFEMEMAKGVNIAYAEEYGLKDVTFTWKTVAAENEDACEALNKNVD